MAQDQLDRVSYSGCYLGFQVFLERKDALFQYVDVRPLRRTLHLALVKVLVREWTWSRVRGLTSPLRQRLGVYRMTHLLFLIEVEVHGLQNHVQLGNTDA
jgi:hypothetical protein